MVANLDFVAILLSVIGNVIQLPGTWFLTAWLMTGQIVMCVCRWQLHSGQILVEHIVHGLVTLCPLLTDDNRL